MATPSSRLSRRALLRSTAVALGVSAALPLLRSLPASAASRQAAPGGQVQSLKLLVPDWTAFGRLYEAREWSSEFDSLDPRTRATFEILQQWKAAHPNVTLEIEETKWDGIAPKFVTRMQGGDPPDLVYINDIHIRELANGGHLLPLNGYDANWADYNQALLKGVTMVGDDIFGAPHMTDCRLVYYWKDAWAKAGITTPPTTWAELYDVAQKLNALGLAGYATPLGPSVHTPTQSVFASVWMQGSELEDAEKRALFDQPAVRSVYEHLNKLVNELKVTPKELLAATDEQYNALFVEGKQAMQHNGSWRWDAMQVENKGVNADTVGYFRTPKPTADARDATLTGFWAFELPRTGDKARQDAAWEIAHAFTSAQGQLTMVTYTNALPTRASVLTDPNLPAKSDFWKYAAQYAVEGGHGMPSALHGQFFMDQVTFSLQKYLSGELSLEAALAEAQKNYNENLG